MTLQPQTPAPAAVSALDAYASEFRRLSEAIAAFLDIMERRSDLSSPGDAKTLGELSATLRELERRVSSHSSRTSGEPIRPAAETPSLRPIGSVQPRQQEPLHADSDLSEVRRRLAALAGPAVHATVADTIHGGFVDRGSEYSNWMQQPAARPLGQSQSNRSPTPRRDRVQTSDDVNQTGASQTAPRSLADLEQILLTQLQIEPTLRGTSQSMPLPRVFDLLVRFRRTGCLHVRSTDEHLRFVFVEGMVVASSSDNQPIAQRLGEVLEQMGIVPRRHLQALVDRSVREQKPLGRLLVDEQFLSIPQLVRALTIQVHARLERAYYATRAAFAFVPTTGELIDEHVRVNAANLLSDLKERPRDEN